VTYDPDPGFVGSDTFQIRIDDGTGGYDTFTVTVEVAPPNQTPVVDLDAGGVGLDYNVILALDVGGPVAAVDPDRLVIEDDDATVVSATVTITNLLDGEDESLSVHPGSRVIAAAYDAGLGVLTLTGEDTLAAYEALLRTVEYDDVALEPDTTPRLITFTVNDGELESDPAIATVFITDDWTELELHPGWNMIGPGRKGHPLL